jgi:hypothetical protein
VLGVEVVLALFGYPWGCGKVGMVGEVGWISIIFIVMSWGKARAQGLSLIVFTGLLNFTNAVPVEGGPTSVL